MGQHFASLRGILRMEGEKRQSSENFNDSPCRSSSDMLSEKEFKNSQDNENNENNPSVVADLSLITIPRRNVKVDDNIDNEQLNVDVDNHNARFESIYSQLTDTPQDSTKQSSCCNNGNNASEAESSISISNISISSDDGPVNLSLRRSSKTLSFGRRKVPVKQRNKDQNSTCNHVLSSKKKRSNWVLKFNCAKNKISKNPDIPGQGNKNSECVCTGYRRTEENPLLNSSSSNISAPQSPVLGSISVVSPIIDLSSRFNSEEYPMEDCDERARLQRAREMEEGVEPPPGYRPPNQPSRIQMHTNGITVDSLAALFQAHAGIHAAALTALSQIDFNLIPNIERPIHTQVDYVHCLVPDLQSITSSSFYWGKMDRYEAERLLEHKQDGTFLLRDSAQEEFLFSVSFRKYQRSLHARIEQWNHKFSFDSHDPGVYASKTICGLLEHYKDPSCCMFFEPVLTIPLHRNFAFPLQHLCRAIITSRTTYDGINKLQLPKTLKSYLKEYHYKQRVRIRRLDTDNDVQLDGKSISYLPVA